MEQLSFVDPPNRPMDTTFRPTKGSTLHKDIIFIDVSETEQILVGSTNVTASFWEGSVQTFSNYQSFEDRTASSYYNSSIIHAGKLLPKKQAFIISESPTYLRLLRAPSDCNESTDIWLDNADNWEKIRSISVWQEETKILTAGDKYISVWDIQDGGLKKISDYKDYHTDKITSICTKKVDPNMFASTGVDRRVCIWDSRMDIPARELYINEFCTLTSVCWNPSNDNMLAVGSEAGDIYLLDANQTKEFSAVRHCFDAPVHRVEFSDSGNLAVCGNTSEIQVYNCKKNEFDLIATDRKHTRFVRGLAWANECLYSAGFDTCIYKRTYLV